MEGDDDFGDLYSDVLPPFTTSVQSHPAETDASKSSRSLPIDRHDEEIPYGAPELNNSFPNSNSGLGLELNASNQDKTLAGIVGGNILGVEAMGLEKGDGAKLPEKGAGGLNFMDDDDDINIVVEEGEYKADDFVEKDVKFLDKQENAYSLADGNENVIDHVGAAAVAGVGAEQMIPELSGKLENHEWESDESEDDLQIVLNDNRVQIGMERMPEDDDDDGEALVIVADDGEMSHRHQQTEMEEQVLGGRERPPGADAERKDLGDAAKTSGGGGIAAPTAVQPKIGYSNHMYNHPFQSQFKYVRPGAAPIPGAASLSLGGTPSQAHPPITLGAVAGRGRGDWHPAGVTGAIPMQKGLQPGYGMPIRGANAAGRGYGHGLDFTLPSHKTIFEVDIDGFEEKPWRVPGIDVSNFFNFGLNEESWKDYCKKLEQLHLETSMQSKIRVYESGRAEQDYDPDLPPELAAAVGIQGIRSENANPGKADAGATDLARGSGRPPVPIGRPIPVETGSGVRFPSMDTRRPRMHDSDAVIEITCQSSVDDDDQAEQQENHPAKEDEDLQQDEADRIHRFSHAYNGQKRELVARREQLKNTVNCDEIGREDNLYVVSEAAAIYQPDRGTGFPNEGSDLRSVKGREHVKIPKSTASASSGEEHVINDRNESFGYENDKRNPHLSSSLLIGSDGEQAAAVVDDNDVSVTDDRSFDMEREDMALSATSADACEDGKTRTTTKQKRISDVEQVSQENDDKEDSKASRSSENSKARSGSSKDQRKFHDTFRDEVLQDRYHPHTGNSKRSAGDEDDAHRRSRHGRDEIRNHNMAVKEREDSRSRRGGDSNSSLHRHMKSESTEWRKESNTSERSWRRRDEDLHGRRFRVEDSRKREHGGEIGSRNRGTTRESESSKGDKHHPSRYQLDSGSLRGENHDQNTRSRQRNWDDTLKTQNEKVDDLLNKRRKEGAYINLEHAEKEEVNYNQREGSSRRKRERENSSDYKKTDGDAKLNGDDMHNGKQKQEGSIQKERGDRQRDHDEWRRHKQMHEESLPRREREEKQSVMRSGRPVEDKTGNNHSQRSDDYRRSRREYHSKDVGRHGEQLKRIDRIEIDSFPQDKVHEDAYARENQGGSTRENYRRVDRNDIRGVHASNTSRPYECRQSKESESDHGSLISSKKNKDDRIGQTSEKVLLRGITERGSGADDIHANQQSSGKHGEEASADDDLAGSRRGRSNLEHWTSHKERDFGVTRRSSSSSRKSKDPVTHDSSVASSATKVPEEPPDKAEEKRQPSVNKHAGGEINNAYTKVEDRHLDTVKKLNQTENRPNSEIKTERPARKRRWTGN